MFSKSLKELKLISWVNVLMLRVGAISLFTTFYIFVDDDLVIVLNNKSIKRKLVDILKIRNAKSIKQIQTTSNAVQSKLKLISAHLI